MSRRLPWSSLEIGSVLNPNLPTCKEGKKTQIRKVNSLSFSQCLHFHPREKSYLNSISKPGISKPGFRSICDCFSDYNSQQIKYHGGRFTLLHYLLPLSTRACHRNRFLLWIVIGRAWRFVLVGLRDERPGVVGLGRKSEASAGLSLSCLCLLC